MKVERVEVSSLVNDPNNARKHNAKNIMAIKGSLAKFGQQKPIVVNAKNIVIAGNGTLQAAIEMGWTEIDIVRSELDGFNATAYALADNRTSELAEWDDSALSIQLQALQNDGFNLNDFGFDPAKDVHDDDKSNSDIYTKKIEIPLYEPKGTKPKISELFSTEKTLQLIAEIEKSESLSPEFKKFVILAAYRHTVFDYEKIAEYYSHADKIEQEFIEKSAMVIIDFNKAIENGFVTMTKEIAEYFDYDQE